MRKRAKTMQSYLRHGLWPFLLTGVLFVTAVACSEEQVFVSDKGFIKVGMGTNLDDVYPPELDPPCVSPGPGYPPPATAPAGSLPMPGYLPGGFALSKELRNPDGRHVADSYVGAGRFSVSHGTCGGFSIPAKLHWELGVTVADYWGILFEGACFEGSDGGCDWDPDFARTLMFETDQGYVEITSLVHPLDKGELLKIAESLPVFNSQGS